MARFIVPLVCLLLPFSLLSGLTFQKTFGGNSTDAARDVVVLSRGNQLLNGPTTSVILVRHGCGW
ncbi:MAG: hypothetical protein Kow0037_01240 [Calditrichia bacterium]